MPPCTDDDQFNHEDFDAFGELFITMDPSHQTWFTPRCSELQWFCMSTSGGVPFYVYLNHTRLFLALGCAMVVRALF